ncbi:hypothetical protein POW16_30030, partial [Raoultella planticola]|uniref:hypothetical protein n=1 Tax=Raoultella planticola TaxID=575 RepID=UPI002FF45FD7
MKLKRNNPFPAETRNAVTVGEPGSGKKAFSSELIFARSDVSQLKLDWPLYFQTLFIALPITGSPPQIFP